jgi:hypothetical protein
MRSGVIAAAALALASPAVAARFNMQFQPADGQSLRMEDGIGTIENHGAIASIRMIQADKGIERRGSISIMVFNRRDTSFNFGAENVTARLADGTRVPIITYEQLAAEERRRQGRRRLGAFLGAFARNMQAASRARSYGSATYSGSTWGTVGGTPYWGSTTGTVTVDTYDPAAAAEARAVADAQNRQVFENVSVRNAEAMEALREIIRTTTVDPGQIFGGTVAFELPASVRDSRADLPVTFLVTIDGEVHQVQTVLVRE